MNEEKLDFGGSRLFENFPLILGLIFFISSIAVFFYFTSYLQIISLPLILLSANFFTGTYVTRNFSKVDNMTLPFVDLFPQDADFILDAGCGSGRATIELSKVFKGKIVAFDLFDPSGESISSRDLLEKNLEIAKISNRVQVVKGDVMNIEFEDNTFDAAISSLLINNLGESKLIALKELFRVLKPGGKILIIVPASSLQTFAVMSFFSLVLTSSKKWHSLFKQAGFKVQEEGNINFGKFYLLEK